MFHDVRARGQPRQLPWVPVRGGRQREALPARRDGDRPACLAVTGCAGGLPVASDYGAATAEPGTCIGDEPGAEFWPVEERDRRSPDGDAGRAGEGVKPGSVRHLAGPGPGLPCAGLPERMNAALSSMHRGRRRPAGSTRMTRAGIQYGRLRAVTGTARSRAPACGGGPLGRAFAARSGSRAGEGPVL